MLFDVHYFKQHNWLPSTIWLDRNRLLVFAQAQCLTQS